MIKPARVVAQDGIPGGCSLPAEWLSNSSDVSGRLTSALEGGLHQLSRPARLRRLRQILMVLFALWAVVALSRLVWGLLPVSRQEAPATAEIINPVTAPSSVGAVQDVDIDRMVSWHLFGEAGAETVPAVEIAEQTPAQEAARAGIEKDARESRLDLKLRGVVASTEDGLGHAIIEYKKQQAVYAVEDKLPVSGKVVLAKVMHRQVVLDNGGTYELLTLFEDSELDTQLPPGGTPASRSAPRTVKKRVESDASALARDYRERLYQNPQSLAEVVSVNAVREDGELLGYRIAPGARRDQFEQLGFKGGDLVTGINGIALNDPANTMRLYQTMRTAPEAVFELQRNGEPITLSVSLDEIQVGD